MGSKLIDHKENERRLCMNLSTCHCDVQQVADGSGFADPVVDLFNPDLGIQANAVESKSVAIDGVPDLGRKVQE